MAVSGGGDSLALMHLLADWAQGAAACAARGADRRSWPARGFGGGSRARRRLRPERRALPAHILTRKARAPKSDIEAAAREARYGLMGAWLKQHGIATLYVGHTLDDQAETFLLRLARGSGLDGLSAMRRVGAFSAAWLRGLESGAAAAGHRPRSDLRAYLKERAPGLAGRSHEQRSRALPAAASARLMPALEAAGLSPARIADAAAHLARAREALELATEAVLARGGAARRQPHVAGRQGLGWRAPREVGLRALAALLMAVSGEAYRPRFEALERLFDSIAAGKLGGGATLHGCRDCPGAPRRPRLFGPETLILARESSRKAAKGLNRSGRAALRKHHETS